LALSSVVVNVLIFGSTPAAPLGLLVSFITIALSTGWDALRSCRLVFHGFVGGAAVLPPVAAATTHALLLAHTTRVTAVVVVNALLLHSTPAPAAFWLSLFSTIVTLVIFTRAPHPAVVSATPVEMTIFYAAPSASSLWPSIIIAATAHALLAHATVTAVMALFFATHAL